MSRGAVVVALALIATPALAQSQPDQILEVVVGPSADADADADETIEVIVQGVPAPPGPPSRTVLDRRTAARVPGSEGDAAKVVQSLPGVSRAGLGSGEVVVWGAASEDTRIYLDGVPVPALYHFGGRRGLVPTHTLRAIELVPGAYGLDRGRGLGGLVELSTATSDREGTHGVLTLDTVDAAVVGQVWRPGEVDALAAARYGYHERLVRVVAPEVLEHYPVPRYHDVLVKVTREGAGPQIGALVLVTGDHLERVIRSEDAGVRRSEARSRDTLRCALRIEHAHDDGRRSSGLLYAGHDRNDTESRFGSVPFGQTSRDWLYGLRAEHGIALGGPLTAHLGLDVEGHHVALHRRGSLTLPAREGDRFVFGQPPPSEVTSDRWTVDQVGVAAYLAPQLVLGPLRVVVGGRAELTLLAGDRGQLAPPRVPSIGFTTLEPTFDPRLQVSVAVRDDLELMASAGSYHQPPRPEDLSAVFGNPGLESERHRFWW